MQVMHEFSLAAEVLKIAGKEAGKNNARAVNEITIEIGNMSGVEISTFRSALEMLSEGSILDKTRLNLIMIKGKGFCRRCSLEFEMEHRTDTCPACSTFPEEIRNGHEFRIVSLLIEEE